MFKSSEEARNFIAELTNLATRLAAQDIVVSHLHSDWASFGSWTVEIQEGAAADAYGAALLRAEFDATGPDVLRFEWDGKEKFLAVTTAPTEPLTTPGPWRTVLERGFETRSAALEFVEDYARQWGK